MTRTITALALAVLVAVPATALAGKSRAKRVMPRTPHAGPSQGGGASTTLHRRSHAGGAQVAAPAPAPQSIHTTTARRPTRHPARAPAQLPRASKPGAGERIVEAVAVMGAAGVVGVVAAGAVLFVGAPAVAAVFAFGAVFLAGSAGGFMGLGEGPSFAQSGQSDAGMDGRTRMLRAAANQQRRRAQQVGGNFPPPANF